VSGDDAGKGQFRLVYEVFVCFADGPAYVTQW
jgi:hypothetical protein